MTGFESKRQMAQAKLDDDDTPVYEVYADTLLIVYQRGFADGKAAVQRKPHYDKTEMNYFVQNLYDEKMREGKHGHYETMFHVVHCAIEAAHNIKEQP